MMEMKLLILILFSNILFVIGNISKQQVYSIDGQAAFKKGQQYLKSGKYEEAGEEFWTAILHSQNLRPPNDLKAAFENFLMSYRKRNMVEYGLVRVAKQYMVQGLFQECETYLNQALDMNPNLIEAHLLLAKSRTDDPNARLKHLIEALRLDPDGYSVTN